ncbi:P-loop containing nucleoside triphosphate hydrolase protein [Russula earlei]|uniref:P-loop containing nucleoside triphosphate hydrolase protein n=1 Tax=Russula earlei TaxID=71964 RepID=A0ACC0UFL0_9AGAM|nr:P-loop containing nucleoside triphosphate hydrolase protein [Russula earlei]
MEAFHLLSRGGVNFDKQKFQSDVRLFRPSSRNDADGKERKRLKDGDLPPELDFFKYAMAGTSKRKMPGQGGDDHAKRKRHRKEEIADCSHTNSEDERDGDSNSTIDLNINAPMPRHRVTTKGNNVPKRVETFEELRDRYRVNPQLMGNLKRYGYEYPTGIQSSGCPILLESRDLAAISPTGTGKTLSYLLPVMTLLNAPISNSTTNAGKGIRAIILAPTRELAHQIYNECLKLAQGRKWRIVLFSKATAATLADKGVQDKVDVVISTPLRLVSSLRSGHLSLHNVRHLVLDEADRMLDQEFLDQVQEILAACTHESIQKAVFSATLPAGAERVALDMLRDPIRVVVGLKDTPLPLIAQSLTYVADDHSKLPTLRGYLSQPYNPPVLIFTSSQPRATSLAEELVLNGIPNVDCLHAGMTRKERDEAVSRMRLGQSWVMISTEVMARGMDFRGIREVINYDFPRSVQSYVHRIGRTGRAGREGKAVTYFTDDDAPYLKAIANVLLQSGSPVPEWILKLPKPSKLKRKQMGKVHLAEAVNPARSIGRSDAIKKRDMIAGSRRRKEKALREKGIILQSRSEASAEDSE